MIHNRLVQPKHLRKGIASQAIPRYVKCSGAAFGLLVMLGVTNAQLKEYYPLDFNTNGGPLMLPKRENSVASWELIEKK